MSETPQILFIYNEGFLCQLIVLAALDIVRVQILMRGMTSGLTPLFIEVHQGLVLVGLTNNFALILAINRFHSLLADNVDVLLGPGLPAAG